MKRKLSGGKIVSKLDLKLNHFEVCRGGKQKLKMYHLLFELIHMATLTTAVWIVL